MLNINVKYFYSNGNLTFNSCSLGCNLNFEVDLKPVTQHTQQSVVQEHQTKPFEMSSSGGGGVGGQGLLF